MKQKKRNIKVKEIKNKVKGSKVALTKHYWPNIRDADYVSASFVLGMGSFWTFPWLHMKYGFAFWIPYFLFLICFAIPCRITETYIGHFSSLGPLKCWGFSKLFRGVGLVMTFVSCLFCIYYGVMLSWVVCYIYHMISSSSNSTASKSTAGMPWSECDNEWNTNTCEKFTRYDEIEDRFDYAFVANFEGPESCENFSLRYTTDGTCRDNLGRVGKIYDLNIASENGIFHTVATTPAYEFFYLKVIGKTYDNNMSSLGKFHGETILCLLFVWTLVSGFFLLNIRRQATIWTILTQSLMLLSAICLLIVLEVQEHYKIFKEGWNYAKTLTKWSKLTDVEVWVEAASVALFTYGVGFGGFISVSSYRQSRDDLLTSTLWNTLKVAIVSIMSSVSALLWLGCYHANGLYLHHKNFTEGFDFELGFVVAPDTMNLTSKPKAFCAWYLFVLFTFGLVSLLSMVFNIKRSLTDALKEDTTRGSQALAIGIPFVLFFVGVLICTDGGLEMIPMLKHTVESLLHFIVMVTLMAITWSYGLTYFLSDIKGMVRYEKRTWKKISPAMRSWWYLAAGPGLIVLAWCSVHSVMIIPWGVTSTVARVTAGCFVCGGYICFHVPVIQSLMRQEGSLKRRISDIMEPCQDDWVARRPTAILVQDIQLRLDNINQTESYDSGSVSSPYNSEDRGKFWTKKRCRK